MPELPPVSPRPPSVGSRGLVRLAGVLVGALPAAVVITLWLTPAWRWVEAATGVEAIGHSGPAWWCYLLLYATWAAGLAAITQRTQARQPDERERVV